MSIFHERKIPDQHTCKVDTRTERLHSCWAVISCVVGIKINLGSCEAATSRKGLSAERAGVCREDGESDAEKGREGMERERHGVLRVLQF